MVAQADSLRAEGRMYGIDEGDSLTLAQAYETLKNHSAFSRQLSDLFPFVHCTSSLDTYAHACYHYGRLLREKDNPVEAMQVFIDATHSHTRDYHILGRIYSNMGDIAHLAGDYSLSYEMYEKSGEMYLKSGDTILYYYDLNNMALELAEQGKKEETFALLVPVEEQCLDQGVIIKLLETKAEMYYKVQEYDSAIFCINKLTDMGYTLPSGMLIKAQAYSYLAEKDSALYYAQKVADTSHSLNDLYNALYILSYDDTTLITDEILKLTSQRDDLHTYKIDVQKTEHSKAVQILEQDLHRKLNLNWLYAIIATIFAIGIFLGFYVYRKRNQHKLLSQQVDDLKDIRNVAKQEHEQIVQEHTKYQNQLLSQIEDTCDMLYQSPHLKKVLCWSDYDQMCKIVNQQFFFFAKKLQNTHLLSEREIRLCVLVLIGITNSKLLAEMLLYSESGIRNFKSRTAKKLDTNSVELRNKLLKFAIGQ